jgi:hypothetical protein
MHLAEALHKTLEEILALSVDEKLLWAAHWELKHNGK